MTLIDDVDFRTKSKLKDMLAELWELIPEETVHAFSRVLLLTPDRRATLAGMPNVTATEKFCVRYVELAIETQDSEMLALVLSYLSGKAGPRAH